MEFSQPSARQLVLAWIVLMLLTAATMFWGRAAYGDMTPLGPVWATLLLATTPVKASLVLLFFLNLRVSSRGWRIFFHLFIVGIAGLVLAAYMSRS